MAKLAIYCEPLEGDLREVVISASPPQIDVIFTDDPCAHPRAKEAEFAIVATRTVDAALLRCLPALKFVQHQGVGTDNVDMAALSERDILFSSMPVGFGAVAEHATMLMLAALRHLGHAISGVRNGDWPQWSLRSISRTLASVDVGILGMGRIGREVAKRLSGFKVNRLIYADMHPLDASQEAELGCERVSVEDLFRKVDVLTIHLPANSRTRGLVSRERLFEMRPDAVLVNTSRGEVIDELALIDALKDGPVAAAALDVLAEEPVGSDHPLLEMPNVIITPHIAAGTKDVFLSKMEYAFENMIRVSNDQTPHWLVGPAVDER